MTISLPHRSVLVLGGIRSGKSIFAEDLVIKSGLQPVYLATGQALDQEMTDRIARHKARRGGIWQTVEAPLELAACIKGAHDDCAILADCLSLWVTNLMVAGCDLDRAFDELIDAIEGRMIVMVSNEVGLGGMPMNRMARQFADACGTLHQMIAARVDAVALVTAGLPLWLKCPEQRCTC